MIWAGSGATTEAWSEQLKPNISCAHPCAASPLFIVVEMIAGIRPAAPGYREITITPRLPTELTDLRVRLPTAAGEVAVGLHRAGARLDLDVTVPPGVHARLRVGEEPVGGLSLLAGRHRLQL